MREDLEGLTKVELVIEEKYPENKINNDCSVITTNKKIIIIQNN